MESKLTVLSILIFQVAQLSTSDINKNNKNQHLFTPASDEEYTIYDDIEEYNDNKEEKFRQNDKELEFSNTDTSPQPNNTHVSPTYAVTEDIDDVPDNTTVKGPIITNYTILVPLNNATVNNSNTTGTEQNTNNTDNTKASSRKNYISILHIKAEYGNDKPDVTVIQNNSPFPQFNGFREYIKGIRQGIVNGLQSLLNRDKETNINEGPTAPAAAQNVPIVHNVVNSPIVLWNKLHDKSSDAVRKVHQGLFGRHF